MASIQKRNNNYKISVSLGYGINGKQIRKTTTFVPPQNVTSGKADKLAEQFAFEFEQHCKGKNMLNENMRYSELCDWYFENYAINELKPNTEYNYKKLNNNYFLPIIGNYKLKDITTPKITELYKDLKINSSSLKHKISDLHKELNPSSIKKIHTVISSIFTCAVKQGFIKENPCRNAILPKCVKKEKTFLDEKQAKKILTIVSTKYSQFNTIIKLLLYTGIRGR